MVWSSDQLSPELMPSVLPWQSRIVAGNSRSMSITVPLWWCHVPRWCLESAGTGAGGDTRSEGANQKATQIGGGGMLYGKPGCRRQDAVQGEGAGSAAAGQVEGTLSRALIEEALTKLDTEHR